MKLFTETVTITHFENWNSKLLKCPYSLASQTANWQYAFKEIYDSEPFFISVCNDKNQLLGQLAGVIHKKFYWEDANILSKKLGNALNLGRILYWLYGPIIYEPSLKDEILEEIFKKINDLASKKNVSFITGYTSPMFDISSTKWQENGYTLKPWKTYNLDLNPSIDDLYKSLHKKVRYDIRKAEKENFELEIVTDKKSMIEYHKLKIKIKKMQGGKVRNETFFDSRWRLLHKEGYAKLIAARVNGKMIGGIHVLTLNKNVIQHSVGTLPEYPLSGTFLTWNAIKWAKENQFKTFDFGGANPSPNSDKEKRIDFYKSKWKGKELRYYICTKKVKPLAFNISTVLKNPSKISNIMTKYINT